MTMTLDIDEQTLAQARAYAQGLGAPLEEIVEIHLRQLAIKAMTREELVEAYRDHVTRHAGRSPDGWKFNREEIYAHRLDRYAQR